MRIRSIRPEFWTSEDIASLSWEQRLIYIGLWSYVDDNGVGRDIPKLIAADLFPLEDDLPEVVVRVQGALTEYSRREMITRYTVSGKPFLHVAAWEKHQKINRPSEGRYPLPTRDDAVIHDTLTEGSLSTQANEPLGEGEKGRRGEEVSRTSAPLGARFDEWWSLYPKKENKKAAEAKWKTITRTVDPALLIAGLERYVADISRRRPERHFIKGPDVWLNKGCWEDEYEDTRPRELVPSYADSPPPMDPDDLPW